MAKNEKIKKLGAGKTKSVSGGPVYWVLDDDGNVKSFVAGREYDSALEAMRADMRLGGQPGVVQMNSVDADRRAPLVEAAARAVNERIIDDGERRRH